MISDLCKHININVECEYSNETIECEYVETIDVKCNVCGRKTTIDIAVG